MPAAILETIDSFITEYHVERRFIKRQRDRAEPQMPGHLSEGRGNSK
jgi:hypothetical protein